MIKRVNLKFVKGLIKRKTTSEIIIHCTASKCNKNLTIEQIHSMHIRNGWAGIGYNYYIDLNGIIWEGRPEDYSGSHTTNHNSKSIGICYCGGLNELGKPCDTRNQLQISAMKWLCRYLHKKYPNATFHGHKEFANKACPCFNVNEWIQSIKTYLDSNNDVLLQKTTKDVALKNIKNDLAKIPNKLKKYLV